MLSVEDGKFRTLVPVYLPDQTVMTEAVVEIKEPYSEITISFEADSVLGHFVKEQLVGISVVYMSADARHEHQEAKEKKNDE